MSVLGYCRKQRPSRNNFFKETEKRYTLFIDDVFLVFELCDLLLLKNLMDICKLVLVLLFQYALRTLSMGQMPKYKL